MRLSIIAENALLRHIQRTSTIPDDVYLLETNPLMVKTIVKIKNLISALFHYACQISDKYHINYFLSSPWLDPNQKQDGRPPIVHLIKRKQLRLVQKLASHPRININFGIRRRFWDRSNMLSSKSILLETKDIRIMKYLLSHPDFIINFGIIRYVIASASELISIPLTRASLSDLEIFTLLNYTIALQKRHTFTEIVRICGFHNKLNMTDDYGHSLIETACIVRNRSMLELLLNYGIDISPLKKRPLLTAWCSDLISFFDEN